MIRIEGNTVYLRINATVQMIMEYAELGYNIVFVR